MSDTRALVFAANGADRPLHQDRQVLRAGDLKLEQTTQDAQLARMRAHLHGWGVVTGFLPTVSESRVGIGPGYGVTPLGDELFLPAAVELSDLVDQAIACCGPSPLSCSVVDLEARAAARRAAENVTVTAWLIARPASRESALRAGVPEDCAHPATMQLPSRRCGGLEFALLCTLPTSHRSPARDCATLAPFVCGVPGSERKPLPWLAPLGPEANFLVIAKLTINAGVLTATTDDRRALWPVALIQDWILACVCPALSKLENLLDDDDDGEGLATIYRKGARKPLTRSEVLELRRQYRALLGSFPEVDFARRGALAGIGVHTQGEFLTTETIRLSEALHERPAQVLKFKEKLSDDLNLDLEFY